MEILENLNILAKLFNKKTTAFVYNDKGSMATIGRNKAVVDLENWKFQGVFAWFVWMFVHLFSLIGFRNKVIVFLNWVYNYILFDRETRLIIRPYKKKKKLKIGRSQKLQKWSTGSRYRTRLKSRRMLREIISKCSRCRGSNRKK